MSAGPALVEAVLSWAQEYARVGPQAPKQIGLVLEQPGDRQITSRRMTGVDGVDRRLLGKRVAFEARPD
ncbi:MAG: hypothetical protein ABSC31_05225 [Acidimicrobiales bacterium]|jgi:hypothetical protein